MLTSFVFGGSTVPSGDGSVKCYFPSAVEAFQERNDPGRRGPGSQREERQKSVVSGQFRIHYDTTGSHAAALLDEFYRPIPGTANAFADSALSIAQAVRRAQLDILGYLPPPSDVNAGGGPEYDIYILNLGALYGSTFPETPIDSSPDGARYTNYIEIDNDFLFVNPPANRGLPALRVTLAHEFYHAIQLGAYGLWEEHIYFYEMTATWMEDVIYDDVDDYLQYLFASESQFSRPDLTFAASTLIMYSRAVWGHFIAERYSKDAMRAAWELSFQYHVSPLAGMDLSLQSPEYGSDLKSAFSEWGVWNYFTGTRHQEGYYPEGDRYPVMTSVNTTFSGVADTLSGSLPPLAARYHHVSSSGPGLWLVATNLDVNGADAGDVAAVNYAYYLNTGQPDDLYQETPAGISVKPSVEDPFVWGTWVIVNDLASELGTELPAVASGVPFPNPFNPEIHRAVNIPVGPKLPLEVDLSVFSSDMALIYSIRTVTTTERGQRVIPWNGMTSKGEVAQTGVYFYAVVGSGIVEKGKFALVRR